MLFVFKNKIFFNKFSFSVACGLLEASGMFHAAVLAAEVCPLLL